MILVQFLLLAICVCFSNGFAIVRFPNLRLTTTSLGDSAASQANGTHPTLSSSPPSISDYLTGVVAPLKYIGPYSCLSLRFPYLKNSTMDFMLDTGANVNSLNAKLVKELDLPLVRSTKGIPLLGTTGGGISKGTGVGDLYLLGNCELEGLPPPIFTFMRNLTAAALPFASPVGVGLLSIVFFYSFPAGVEFDWYGTDGDPPTLIFYFGQDPPAEAVSSMKRVPLTQLAAGVVTLDVKVNGVVLPALLDTGAPITVLNQHAAELVGVATSEGVDVRTLKIGGVDGGQMDLQPSPSNVTMEAEGVSLGSGPVFIGNLPGLALMSELQRGGTKVPAVVLGLDFLRRAYRMLLRAPNREVWFEELADQPRWTPP